VVVKMQRRDPARRSRRPSSIFSFRDDKVLSDLTCNIPCALTFTLRFGRVLK
jgi:hypothetical protein